MTGKRIAWGALALSAFAAFFGLGRYVTQAGEPPALVAWERAIVDHSTLIAWWLTWMCYPQILIPIALALSIVAWRVPEWRGRIVLSIVLLLVCWQGADLFQHVFARPRRLDWVVKHETAFSYPSSHAAMSFGFYGLWAAVLWAERARSTWYAVAGALLAEVAVAVCWSRLALGAHYVTDLAGGALLGIAFTCAAIAFVPSALPNPTKDATSTGA
ncbi:MAG: phosphatase PAP2 family protein [Candidatus Eremiobacteraeota bacterium]|nr:phosphatase PAP2 family protein [Candidatus Eremiobacteraeota bacterium]